MRHSNASLFVIEDAGSFTRGGKSMLRRLSPGCLIYSGVIHGAIMLPCPSRARRQKSLPHYFGALTHAATCAVYANDSLSQTPLVAAHKDNASETKTRSKNERDEN